jgi:hypothetical protein
VGVQVSSFSAEDASDEGRVRREIEANCVAETADVPVLIIYADSSMGK